MLRETIFILLALGAILALLAVIVISKLPLTIKREKENDDNEANYF